MRIASKVNFISQAMMAPLIVGRGAGEGIDAVIVGMAAVPLDPAPVDPVRGGGRDQLLPQLGILNRLPVRGPPAVALPIVDPTRDSVADVDAVGMQLHPAGALE